MDQMGACEEEDGEEDWTQPAGDYQTHGRFGDRNSGGTAGQPVEGVAPPNSLPESKIGHQRTIVHIDVDCFYAQVEMIRNPSFRDVPLGIQQKHIIVTSNYPARARGVTKLTSVVEAKKKCPELVLVSGEDLTHYREMSYKISEFFVKYTPNVERLGFDENYLDVTEMVDQRIRGQTAKTEVEGHVYGMDESPESKKQQACECPCGCHFRLAVGSQIAADIRSALCVELGVTCCAGIAHNKLLAKLVGTQHKPNQQTTLFPEHALKLVTGMGSVYGKIGITGIGWSSSQRLKSLGVMSVTDLQQFSVRQLEEEFGVAVATTMRQLCFGVDDSPVVAYSRPQTLSIEDSFRRCSSEADARSRVCELMDLLISRIRDDGRTPHTLRLSVRKASRENRYPHRESRQRNVPTSIFSKLHSGRLDSAKETLVSMAMSLFHKMVDVKQAFHLTLINVGVTKLEETAANSISSFLTSPPKSRESLPFPVFQAKSPCLPDSFVSQNMSQRSVSSPASLLPRHSQSLQNDSHTSSSQYNFDTGTPLYAPDVSNSAETDFVEEYDESTGVNNDGLKNNKGAKRQNSQLLNFVLKKQRMANSICVSPSATETHVGDAKKVKRVDSSTTGLSEKSGGFNSSATPWSAIGGGFHHVFQPPPIADQDVVDVGIPPGIDPDVFSQLPPEIQQDILHNYVPPATHTTPLAGAITQGTSSPLLMPNSENEDRRVKRDSIKSNVRPAKRPLFQGKQSSVRKFAVKKESSVQNVAEKKASENGTQHQGLSPTATQAHITAKGTLYRSPSVKNISNTSQNVELTEEASVVISQTESHRADSSQEPVLSAPATSVPDPSLESATPVCTATSSSNTCNADTSSTSTDTSPDSKDPRGDVRCDWPSSSAGDCAIISDDLAHNPPTSTVKKLTRKELSVPKGIAHDVFSVLPPDIQRELVAEAAIERHRVLDGHEGSLGGGRTTGRVQVQKKGQGGKNPGGRCSTMLKFLNKK